MKLGWATRITILYLSFVTLIITLVAKSMSQRMDLVVPDYYEEELKFQRKIEKINNTKSLQSPLRWEVYKNTVNIIFPHEFANEHISGQITFFRPSDSRQDKIINLQPSKNNIHTVDISGFKKGLYNLQIDWNYKQTEYYNEGVINIK